MPITVPAHQILVAPFVRVRGGWLPGSALMLGAALPDLGFPLGGYPASAFAHEAYGPAVLAVTAGIVLYVWCERVLAPAMRRAMPERWARLFVTRGLASSAWGWLAVVAALVLGAYTHVIFDGFTHAWMWPADLLYPDVFVGSIRLTHVLQLAGSVIGSIAAVAWAYRRTGMCPPVAADPRWSRNLVDGAVVALGGGLVGLALGLVLWGWPVHYRDYTTLACPMLDAAFVAFTVRASWSKRSPTA